MLACGRGRGRGAAGSALRAAFLGFAVLAGARAQPPRPPPGGAPSGTPVESPYDVVFGRDPVAPDSAAAVNTQSTDGAHAEVFSGGGYGPSQARADSYEGARVFGPRLCVVLYASQRWRWGVRWDSAYNIVGDGEDGRGPFTTRGTYDDRGAKWTKRYAGSKEEIFFEGWKDGDTIEGVWTEAATGARGEFTRRRGR